MGTVSTGSIHSGRDRKRGHLTHAAAIAALVVLCAACGAAEVDATDPRGPYPARESDTAVILATTSSTYDSGLLDDLIPRFEARSGLRVKTIAVGSGQALALGERGEADLVLVHAPEAEERFMARSAGLLRRRMMYNDFVLVGPISDPAGVRYAADARSALAGVARAGVKFMSRGDDSGTHQLERKLWDRAGIMPGPGASYLETGQGMGATLRIASEMGAYTLTDRGTYLSQRPTLDLEILVEGDPVLRNEYHLIVVNPRQGPQVNAEGAEALARFLLSGGAMERVRNFGRERFGRPLFVPDAEPLEPH